MGLPPVHVSSEGVHPRKRVPAAGAGVDAFKSAHNGVPFKLAGRLMISANPGSRRNGRGPGLVAVKNQRRLAIANSISVAAALNALLGLTDLCDEKALRQQLRLQSAPMNPPVAATF
jgi:hypothetical protein